MSPIDALIPFVFGVLLLVRPQAFLKRALSEDQRAQKQLLLRRIGYVLIGVAALYAVIALVER